MTDLMKSNWPPIDQAFKESGYPSVLISTREIKQDNVSRQGNDITINRYTYDFPSLESWARDSARKILALGITDFQVTTEKNEGRESLKMYFRYAVDYLKVAGTIFPVGTEFTLHDSQDLSVSAEAHKQAAEEFFERFGIFALVRISGRGWIDGSLTLKFHDCVDAAAYVHARMDGGFIKVRAHKIDQEMKQAQAHPNQPAEQPPSVTLQ